MRTAVVALLLCSCIGLPDRAEVEVGHGYGAFESSSGVDFDNGTGWVALTLGFPIRYGAERMRAAPPPPKPTSGPTSTDKPETPWWEDYALVKGLAILILGGAAAKGAGPGYRKCKALLRRRPE